MFNAIALGVSTKAYDKADTAEVYKIHIFMNFTHSETAHQMKLPHLDPAVYTRLPKLLTNLLAPYVADGKPQLADAQLLASLATISAVFGSNAYFLYDGEIKHPNLYGWVLAPAGSGKGQLKKSLELVRPIHNSLYREYTDAYDKYKADIRGLSKSAKSSISPPRQKGILIPGNSSSSALIHTLRDYDRSSLIFETEADSLSQVLRSEWGGISDLLRKAYEHEPISQNRRSDGEMLYVDKPLLSVFLTSTHSQLGGLIKSASNGLMSRFLFYLIHDVPEWRNITANGSVTGSVLNDAANEVTALHEFFSGREIEFVINQEERDLLNATGHRLTEYYRERLDEEFCASLFRYMQSAARIAVSLTAIRAFESGDKSATITVRTQDMETAVEVVEVLLEHAAIVFENLPSPSAIIPKARANQLYEILPKETDFKRSDIVQLAKDKLKMAARTVDRTLADLFKNNKITKVSNGVFKKQ